MIKEEIYECWKIVDYSILFNLYLNCFPKKKSLAQEVSQKRDISERFAPFNLYFVCNTSNCVTVRPVKGHLTPKINIAYFIRNFVAFGLQ